MYPVPYMVSGIRVATIPAGSTGNVGISMNLAGVYRAGMGQHG
jgi:hypothetical protein